MTVLHVEYPYKADWLRRWRLELHAIVNLASGLSPTALPIVTDPEVLRFRTLKDAAAAGLLRAELDGPTPDFMSRVRLIDLTGFAETADLAWLNNFVAEWRRHVPEADLVCDHAACVSN